MSTDFSLIQKSICDIKTGKPTEEPVPIEYCPTCLIDKNAPTKKWWNETDPYLNGQTCEYYVPININADGDTYTTADLKKVKIPFNIFKYSYIRPAIRKLLKHYNKIDSDEMVCAKMPKAIFPGLVKKQLYKDKSLWKHLGSFYENLNFVDVNGNEFKIPKLKEDLLGEFEDITNLDALELYAEVKDYHLGDGTQIIKMLVAIPAYPFDQIPENPLGVSLAEPDNPEDEDEEDEDEPPEEEEYELKSEVELDGFVLKKNIQTMSAVFDKWATYQSLFAIMQGGQLRQTNFLDKTKQKDFYLRVFKGPVKEFNFALEKLLAQNNFSLSEDKSHPEGAAKIKITFKMPTKTKPYRIDKVEAKYLNCDHDHFYPCSIGIDSFLQEPWVKHPTVLNYIAFSEESVGILNAMPGAPWVDWVQQYSYPSTVVQYNLDNSLGKANEDECADEPPTEQKEIWNQILGMDLTKEGFLEWMESQLNCKTINQMQGYDAVAEIDKYKKKFADGIDRKLYTQNNVIKDLFGLPIDWKSIGKRKPMVVLSEWWKTATLCNMSTFAFEILKCLFGTFSLDEIQGIIVKRAILAGGIPLFKSIWDATPTEITSLSQQAAVPELGGWEKTPWEMYEEKLSKEKGWEAAGKYAVWLAGVDETAQDYLVHSDDGTGRPEGFGGAGDAQPNIEEVFDVYLNNYLDNITDVEFVLDLLKKSGSPWLKTLQVLIAPFACPSQNLIKGLLKELKGSIDFGNISVFCDLGEGMLKMPKIPNIPTLEFKYLLRNFLMILVKKLIDIIANLLLAILLKTLQGLSCNLDDLKGLGNWDDLFPMRDNLGDALAESGCDDEDELAISEGLTNDEPAGPPALPPPPGNLNALLNALDAQGVSGPQGPIMAMAADFSAMLGKNEFKKAFISKPDEQDPDFCRKIADIVVDRHPQYAAVLGTPDAVAYLFCNIGNTFTVSQRDAIAASIVQEELDTPIDSSICATNEQKERWNEQNKEFINNLCGNMPMQGFRPGEGPDPVGETPTEEDTQETPSLADDWLDKVNEERSPEALLDAMELFVNGPAAGLEDALNEALTLAAPNCKWDPETGEYIEDDEPGAPANVSIIPPMPEEIATLIDETKKTVYSTVETSFMLDLVGSYDSLLNHLFADTFNHTYYQGNSYRASHKRAVKSQWLFPNAANTLDQWQQKWDGVKDTRFSLKRLVMKVFAPSTDLEGNEIEDHTEEQFPTHLYPQTISIWMRTQMLEQADRLIDGAFATDLGLARPSRNRSVTPIRYDWTGNEKDYNYKRRKWDMEKMVTYSWSQPAIPKPEMVLRFRDNNSGLGGWSYGFNLKLINYTANFQGDQQPEPSYRVILDELQSTNVPAGSHWLTRMRSVEDDGTIKLKGMVKDSSGEISFEEASLDNIRWSRDNYFDINVKADPGNAMEIMPFYSKASPSELSSYNYSGIVFKNYIDKVYKSAGATNHGLSTSFLAKDLFDNLNNHVYSSVLKSTLMSGDGESVTVGDTTFENVPDSFLFGYVDDTLEKADFTYVHPTASSDDNTWEYNNENGDKVLGKSATGNPRIEFLDPEIHGGKYTRPKIYIHPPAYKGWLGLSQVLLPEEDNHEPKRKSFIFTDEVAEKEKDLRDAIPYDERLNDSRHVELERAYDVLNEPSGHAGVHSTVVLTTRIYAFEHMIKSMSIYKILKADFKKNYDASILAAVVEDMEEQIQDTPRSGSRKGFYKGYNYWLLFLEQAVQSVERLVLMEEIEMTTSLAQDFEQLKKIRESMVIMSKADIKWLKYVSSVTWDDEGKIEKIDYGYAKGGAKERKFPLKFGPGESRDRRIRSLITAVMFHSFGKNYQSILAGETRLFAYRMRRKQRNMFKMANKLHNIHRTKELAKRFLTHLVAQQLEFYQEKFSEHLSPASTIADIRKYFFGSSGLLITPLNGGLTTEEQDAGDIFDYGSGVKHVVSDPITQNPTHFFTSEEKAKLLDDSPLGNFYFEKYLKIVEKPTPQVTLAQNSNPSSPTSLVNDRDSLLKGVANIKDFQAWLSTNMNTLSNMHTVGADEEEHSVRISDLFGDAVPLYEDPTDEEKKKAESQGKPPPEPKLVGYEGSIGIKFGVRLCYVPKSDFNPEISNSVARSQMSFKSASNTYIDEEDVEVDTYPDHNVRKIFPIASYERDILDRDISKIDLSDDNFGEDLNCYIDELIHSPQMSLLFDFCFPLRRATSLMSMYSNYAFLPSVGEDSTERDIVNGRTPTQAWRGKIFDRTKHLLRELFVSNYKAVAWGTFVVKEDQKPREKVRRQMQIQAGLSVPRAGYEAAGWSTGRRVVSRPYDKDGNPEEPDDGAI